MIGPRLTQLGNSVVGRELLMNCTLTLTKKERLTLVSPLRFRLHNSLWKRLDINKNSETPCLLYSEQELQVYACPVCQRCTQRYRTSRKATIKAATIWLSWR